MRGGCVGSTVPLPSLAFLGIECGSIQLAAIWVVFRIVHVFAVPDPNRGFSSVVPITIQVCLVIASAIVLPSRVVGPLLFIFALLGLWGHFQLGVSCGVFLVCFYIVGFCILQLFAMILFQYPNASVFFRRVAREFPKMFCSLVVGNLTIIT